MNGRNTLNYLLKMPKKINKQSGPAILQLNVEGLTRSKWKVIQRIATKHSASSILLQEKYTTSNNNIKVWFLPHCFAIHQATHGISTLVRNVLTPILVESSKKDSEMQWLTIMINDDFTITNI